MATEAPVMPNRNTTFQVNCQFKEIGKGMAECPKCFGACELELTKRDSDGWPLGPCIRMTCDHCAGEGEVKPEAAHARGWTGWPEPTRVEVEAVEAPPAAPQGWAIHNG